MITNNDLKEISEKYGTPAYIFDIDGLIERIKAIKCILGDNIKLCYAIKSNPMVIKYIDEIIDRFEVCSPGEYEIIRAENICGQKLILSGVNKSRNDFLTAKQNMFSGIYTIESLQQITSLIDIYKNSNIIPKVIIRLTSGNQFGIDKNAIRSILCNSEYLKNLDIVGIHFYSGTQKKNIETIENEISDLVKFCLEINEEFKIHINEIEYGPGLYFEYFKETDDDLGLVRSLKHILLNFENRFNITIELGRYIVAPCGYYLTKVADMKNNNGTNYCIVDGGMHQITYFGQLAGIRNPIIHSLKHDVETEDYTICGSLCSVHDVLARKIQLPRLKEGDVICFMRCGAYSFMESCALFLSRDIPQVLIHFENNVMCIRKTKQSFALNMTDYWKGTTNQYEIR